MREKYVKNYKKAGVFSGVIVCALAFVVIVANIPDDGMSVDTSTWKPVQVWAVGAENDPGSGESGFLEFFLINVSDANGYKQNTSATLESWAEANMVGLNPYGTADEFHIETEAFKTFAIVVRVRYNSTHAKDGSNWDGSDTDVQLTMTCTNWAVGSNINNVSGTRYESANDSDYNYLYENFVWDNSGTGYQIGDDATWTVSEIYIEAKF